MICTTSSKIEVGDWQIDFHALRALAYGPIAAAEAAVESDFKDAFANLKSTDFRSPPFRRLEGERCALLGCDRQIFPLLGDHKVPQRHITQSIR